MVRIICVLILLVSLPAYAQTGKKMKAQKLTEAEIKEAEQIFVDFRKRLEETNDVQMALRGLIDNNWISKKNAIDLLEDHGVSFES